MTESNNKPGVVRSAWWRALAMLVLALSFCPLVTAQDTPRRAQQWAILIGVENYKHVRPLQYTVNDVRHLRETLRTYGGLKADNILQLTDDGEDDDSQSYSSTIRKRLPLWLQKPGENDTVIVYFSGHGFRDAAGKMYLAPLDFQKDKAAETGIAVDWLRDQIEKSNAQFKLLIIDSCHAGSEKDADSTQEPLTADAVGSSFRGLEGVVTLASCKAEQKSQIWWQKQRSLYSYWMTEGLKGHADSNSNGRVDIAELYDYVERRVSHTADVRFPRKQTPVRIIGSRVTGTPTVITLQPQPIRTLLANMAEHIANIVDEYRLARVGVLEFMDNTQQQQVLDGQFGLLGKFCGDELERRLIELSLDNDFRVTDRKQLWAALREQHFQLEDLSSTPRLTALSKSVGDMPAIALGTIRGRRGRVVRLQVQLKATADGDAIGITGGTAALSVDDYAMLGHSVIVRPEDRTPLPTSSNDRPVPQSEQVITRLDERVEGGHALEDPVFKQDFEITMKVNGKVRSGEFRGNDYFVPVRKGDTYSIQIRNKSGHLAIMRMLVDGLDTTLRVSEPTEVSTDTSKGLATELWAQPVSHIDSAGIRYLDPNGVELNGGPPVWEIMGFTTKTGRKGKVRLFEVVDASDSLAGRQGFTDQLGLITVALYAPAGGPRGQFGTGAGAERDRNIRTRRGPRAGRLKGVFHIRYVDAEALK